MAFKPLPSTDYLRECLKYDSKAGLLIWRRRKGNRIPGKRAGSRHRNGFSLNIDYKTYRVSRIIWKLMTGFDPGSSEVDHRNRDRFDDRWVNLRLATRSQNARNTSGWSKRVLPKGVTLVGKYYVARVWAGSRQIYLGTFATPEKAASVYRAFARSLHGRFYADPTQT